MAQGKKFVPTDADRKQVSQMAMAGITYEQIAMCVQDGISADTLVKYFGSELKTSKTKAIANLAGKLYQRGMDGDTASAIFYLKTQGGWSEKQVLEHQGAGGEPLTLFPSADD